jgi:hypothetical protein
MFRLGIDGEAHENLQEDSFTAQLHCGATGAGQKRLRAVPCGLSKNKVQKGNGRLAIHRPFYAIYLKIFGADERT